MNVNFHPAAAKELRKAEWYIEGRRPRCGTKFREQVDQALRYAASRPGRCVQIFGPVFCSVKVSHFRYRIYYRWVVEVLSVYAVYHASRSERAGCGGASPSEVRVFR